MDVKNHATRHGYGTHWGNPLNQSYSARKSAHPIRMLEHGTARRYRKFSPFIRELLYTNRNTGNPNLVLFINPLTISSVFKFEIRPHLKMTLLNHKRLVLQSQIQSGSLVWRGIWERGHETSHWTNHVHGMLHEPTTLLLINRNNVRKRRAILRLSDVVMATCLGQWRHYGVLVSKNEGSLGTKQHVEAVSSL
jgi:hypothetical protein